ncbi:MAG: TIGR02678 family protein [Gaiellaceae bacterium]
MNTSLANADPVEAVRRADRKRAARALLTTPLLSSARAADAVRLVRLHRDHLARWFSDELGYTLDASRTNVVRLAKTPGAGHVARGLHTPSGREFDGRRYALTCVVMAGLEAAGERTTARVLFDQIAARANEIEGLSFDANAGADRRAFIHSVGVLRDLGVLELAEGDEERFVRGHDGDALYRIRRDHLALMLAAPRPPSLLREPAEMVDPLPADTDEARTRRRRHRVTRALIDEPVVYFDDLDAEEIDYLNSQRARIERVLGERLGLDLEVRTEGLIAIDPDGELTDICFPDYGTAHAAALNICDELRSRRDRGFGGPWALPDIEAFVRGVAADAGGSWRKSSTSPEGARDLTVEAIDLLAAMGLVRHDAGAVSARAALGRYALTARADERAGTSDRSSGNQGGAR